MPRSESERAHLEPRALARLSAERDVKQAEQDRTRSLQILHKSARPLTPDELAFSVGKIADLNELLLQNRNNRDIVNSISLDREYERQVTTDRLDMPGWLVGKNPHDIDAGKQSIRNFVDIMYTATIDSVTECQLKEFSVVDELARDMQTDVVSVYQDDGLYNALQRNVYGTPQGQAEVMLAPVRQEHFDKKVFQFVLSRERNKALASMRKQEVPDEHAEALVRNHVEGLKVNRQYREEVVRPYANYLRTGQYVMVGEQIEELWGSIESLSAPIKWGIFFYRGELEGQKGE